MTETYIIDSGFSGLQNFMQKMAETLGIDYSAVRSKFLPIVLRVVYGGVDLTVLADEFLIALEVDTEHSSHIADMFEAYRIVKSNYNHFIPFWRAWREVSPNHRQVFFQHGPKGGRLAMVLIQNFGTDVTVSQLRDFIHNRELWTLDMNRFV